MQDEHTPITGMYTNIHQAFLGLRIFPESILFAIQPYLT